MAKMSNFTYCDHCLPVKTKGHPTRYIDYFFDLLRSLLDKIVPRELFALADVFQKYLFKLFESMGVLKFDYDPDETSLKNRSLIFFHEARRRGINIGVAKFFGRYAEEFKVSYGGREYFYEGIPLTMHSYFLIDIDDKYAVKRILQANNLPVAEGKIFTSKTKALTYANKLGYPLVVKPRSASLSFHTSYNIHSHDELIKAIVIAKKFRPDFILEKFLLGNLYRATVIGRKYIFACQKERANIVGDGSSTIKKLIDKKNNDPRRANSDQKNVTLHKIPIDDATYASLTSEGLTLDSVPPKNKKIYVQKKNILSMGCDIIDCTNQIHEDNRELFLRIAQILKVDLVGIDFICQDITRSYKDQITGILETNSLPYIDMHQYPSHGASHPVAEIVWNLALKKIEGQTYV